MKLAVVGAFRFVSGQVTKQPETASRGDHAGGDRRHPRHRVLGRADRRSGARRVPDRRRGDGDQCRRRAVLDTPGEGTNIADPGRRARAGHASGRRTRSTARSPQLRSNSAIECDRHYASRARRRFVTGLVTAGVAGLTLPRSVAAADRAGRAHPDAGLRRRRRADAGADRRALLHAEFARALGASRSRHGRARRSRSPASC